MNRLSNLYKRAHALNLGSASTEECLKFQDILREAAPVGDECAEYRVVRRFHSRSGDRFSRYVNNKNSRVTEFIFWLPLNDIVLHFGLAGKWWLDRNLEGITVQLHRFIKYNDTSSRFLLTRNDSQST